MYRGYYAADSRPDKGVNHLQARASTSQQHAPRPSCAHLCHQNAKTDQAPNRPRGARERHGAAPGCAGPGHSAPGTLPAGAPFAMPRPPPGRAGIALFSQHYLMICCRAFTSIRPYQKRANHSRLRVQNNRLWMNFPFHALL